MDAMKSGKAEKVKYPGALGKKTPKPNLLTSLLIGKDEWRADLEAEMLMRLLDHYEIANLKGSEKWFALALALARDNVPAFQVSQSKPPGRPKSKKPAAQHAPRGRPLKYDLDSHESLVYVIDEAKSAMAMFRKEGAASIDDAVMKTAIKEELEHLGGSRITDLSAIRVFVRCYAKETGKSFARQAFEVSRLQKRLPESRAVIRKIQEYSVK